MVSRWEIDSLSRGGGEILGKIPNSKLLEISLGRDELFFETKIVPKRFPTMEFGIFQNLMVLKKCAIIILIILSIDIIVLVQSKRSKNKFLLIDSLR